MKEKNLSDHFASDISAVFDTANNQNSIKTQQLEVLNNLFFSKHYDIKQADIAGVVKCVVFTDNRVSLQKRQWPRNRRKKFKNKLLKYFQ